MVLDALVRGRGLNAREGKAKIDQDWGRGRMVGAKRALELGMVDRVATLQDEIDRMARGLKKGVARTAAEKARLQLA
jgi:ClpP class serine protease